MSHDELTGTMRINEDGKVTIITDRPARSMMAEIEEAYKMLQAQRAKHGPIAKHFEMSTETLRVVENRLGLDNLYKPCSSMSDSLWGVKIVLNEKLPLNEIKPIYE